MYVCIYSHLSNHPDTVPTCTDPSYGVFDIAIPNPSIALRGEADTNLPEAVDERERGEGGRENESTHTHTCHPSMMHIYRQC